MAASCLVDWGIWEHLCFWRFCNVIRWRCFTLYHGIRGGENLTSLDLAIWVVHVAVPCFYCLWNCSCGYLIDQAQYCNCCYYLIIAAVIVIAAINIIFVTIARFNIGYIKIRHKIWVVTKAFFRIRIVWRPKQLKSVIETWLHVWRVDWIRNLRSIMTLLFDGLVVPWRTDESNRVAKP